MNKMKISYCITTHNEDSSLERLLYTLNEHKSPYSEIVIIDDYSTNPKTLEIKKPYSVHQHHLTNDYSEHKNFGIGKCTGDWILALDADEYPFPNWIQSIPELIESNPDVDLYYVPRANVFSGRTPDHDNKWGWNTSYYSIPCGSHLVNWPDYQSRLFKRSENIKWVGKLHETIKGHTKFSFLPADESFCLVHEKTIEKQVADNERYNKSFSEVENKGHILTV